MVRTYAQYVADGKAEIGLVEGVEMECIHPLGV